MSRKYDYMVQFLPKEAKIDFIFHEDFDGDKEKEIVIGYTVWEPSPPVVSILYIDESNGKLTCQRLRTSDANEEYLGVLDGAFAEDTDGDGKKELILGFTMGNGHFITPYIFHWVQGKPQLIWKAQRDFYHGELDVIDRDQDGIYEVIMEESYKYCSGVTMCEASIQFRIGVQFKWDGTTYKAKAIQPKEPCRVRHNLALIFLNSIVKEEFKRAYKSVQLPLFLGISGIDDDSLTAYKNHITTTIMPILMKNLQHSPLIPIEAGVFEGKYHTFRFNFIRVNGQIKISSIDIYPTLPQVDLA